MSVCLTYEVAILDQPPTMRLLIGSCICEIKELSSRSGLYKHWSPRYKQQSVAGTLHSVSGFLSPDPQLLRGKRETPDKLLVTNVNWVLPTLNTQHFYLIMFTPESGVVTGCSGEITSPHHILGIVTHWGWTLQYVKITQRYRQFHFPPTYHLNTPNFLLPTPIFHTILNLFIRFLFGSFFMFELTWLFWRCWKSIF